MFKEDKLGQTFVVRRLEFERIRPLVVGLGSMSPDILSGTDLLSQWTKGRGKGMSRRVALGHTFMAEPMEKPPDDALLLKELSPNFAVLDLGCTRAMVSRATAKNFMNYLDYDPDCGLSYEILPTESCFNFANSESARCYEKLRLRYKGWHNLSTDCEIVEQGDVPF